MVAPSLEQGLVPYFAQNPVAANLLMTLMLAGGCWPGCS